jgi:hypothetical protein
MGAYIVREKYPVLCMGFLPPGLKVAQMLFVLLPETIPVNVIELF